MRTILFFFRFLTKPVTRCVVTYNTKCQTRTVGYDDIVSAPGVRNGNENNCVPIPAGRRSPPLSYIIIRRTFFFFFCSSNPRHFPLNAFARVRLYRKVLIICGTHGNPDFFSGSRSELLVTIQEGIRRENTIENHFKPTQAQN